MKPPTRKYYAFVVVLGSEGHTLEEAWESCRESILSDGLDEDVPPLKPESEVISSSDPFERSILQEEQCQVCGEIVPLGTNTHCDEAEKED